MNWEQLTIYGTAELVEAHARTTDPESSELTLQSLGKDTSYNWRIFATIMELSAQHDLPHTNPVTDDMILERMERLHQRRYQRNVIARQRGLIRQLGWIERVDDVDSHITGRPVIAHVPTAAGVALWEAR